MGQTILMEDLVMAKDTEISWTDHTVNPWIGCFKISTECRNCYAAVMESRYQRANWGKNETRYRTKGAEKSARSYDRIARRDGVRRKIFCASMSDFFEDKQELIEIRNDWWQIIKECNQLDWLILTKRADKIAGFLPEDFYDGAYRHVNLGVSVGVKSSTPRLDHLRAIRDWGGLRWVSMEPLLESIAGVDLTRIDWAIVGGETTVGNDFMPLQEVWVEEIQAACAAHGTTFFFKQTAGRNGTTLKTFRGVQYYDFPNFRFSLPMA